MWTGNLPCPIRSRPNGAGTAGGLPAFDAEDATGSARVGAKGVGLALARGESFAVVARVPVCGWVY